MSYQVFLSYRRNGGEALAFLINERLSAAGYQVFYDLESLTSGKFNTKLFDVIDVCNDVLLILPPNALDRCCNEDDWVRLEIEYALKTGKNVIPIMMKGFIWPEELPRSIRDIKNYNGVEVSFEFFDGVMKKIIKCMQSSSIRINSSCIENKEIKHILFWGDFDHAILEKIVKKMDMEKQYMIEILEDPIMVLSKNLNEIYAIALIVTDCTKFSANMFANQRMNEALVEYVRRGGKLIAAHDVIYRRTKNIQLQDMYGCKIDRFQQTDIVKYVKTTDCQMSGAFASLPDVFELHDAEVCWGKLADDVDIYFETPDGIPLVFSREYGNGICIYFNSGDFKDNPPKSILKPETNFLNILKECILLNSYQEA